jgi:hypothetical protein
MLFKMVFQFGMDNWDNLGEDEVEYKVKSWLIECVKGGMLEVVPKPFHNHCGAQDRYHLTR